jgi:hypothetical protein
MAQRRVHVLAIINVLQEANLCQQVGRLLMVLKSIERTPLPSAKRWHFGIYDHSHLHQAPGDRTSTAAGVVPEP